MRRWRIAGLIVPVLLAGCAGTAERASCPPPLEAVPVVELFFGRGLAEGGEVSDAAWRGFLDEVVTPRFPDGLSVLDAAGQYRSGSAIERENSKLLIIVGPDPGDLDARLDAVIAAYKARFRQQAVLRVDSAACTALR
ncbi:MAG TPA: DUF3574 domain-containing protein [Stellaceae bacterium]|nr:DUF3574 domain-containing protein [Stellaceae bacterium]